MEPRTYQLKIFRHAKESNTIAILPTGSGKTYIASMLAKHVHATRCNRNGEKKLIFFLVNLVSLVEQQAKFLISQTGLKIAYYYGMFCINIDVIEGEMGVDLWGEKQWEYIFEQADMVIMTAQIFLNLLTHGFIGLDKVSLLILDECHHARNRHPYNVIICEHYDKCTEAPLLFGMTACPNIKKLTVRNSIKVLESNLRSKAVTVTQTRDKDLATYSHKARHMIVYYEREDETRHREFFSILESITSLTESSTGLNTIIKRAEYLIDELGLWAGFTYLKMEVQFIEDCLTGKKNVGDLYGEPGSLEEMETRRIVALIKDQLDKQNVPEICESTVSQKFLKLIKILDKFSSDESLNFSCMIFVERRVTSRILCDMLHSFPGTPEDVQPAFLMGHSTGHVEHQKEGNFKFNAKDQNRVIRNFRFGEINTVVSTAVGEEGLDIPSCALVIRFNLPQSLVSFVQSRGRARHKSSNLVMMVNKKSIEEMDLLVKLITQEKEMDALREIKSLCIRGDEGESLDEFAINFDDDDEAVVEEVENEMFIVGDTGAVISFNSSIGIFYRYFSQMVHANDFDMKPEFMYRSHGPQAFICSVFVPVEAELVVIEGKLKQNRLLAKRSTCLEVCKFLLNKNILDTHLLSHFLPSFKRTRNGFVDPEFCQRMLLDGMDIDVNDIPTKDMQREEEFEIETPWKGFCPIFPEDKMEEKEEFYFYSCQFKVDDGSNMRSIGFVTGKRIPWFMDFPVYIPSSAENGYSKIQVSIKENLFQLSRNDLKRIRFVTNCVMRYFFLSNRDGRQKGQNEPAYVYEKTDFESVGDVYNYLVCPMAGGAIDWEMIEFIEDSDRLFREHETGNFWFVHQNLKEKYGERLPGKFVVTDLVDYQRRAIIEEICWDMNCKSPSEQEPGRTIEEHYYKHFRKIPYSKTRLGKVNEEEPLVKVTRMTHLPVSLIPPYLSKGDAPREVPSKLPDFRILKFLVFSPIPVDLVKPIMTLPAVAHQLEAFINVSGFMQEFHVIKNSNPLHFLQALTAPNSSTCYDYERMETLGDSVLKTLMTLFLYVKYWDKKEGSMSYARHINVSNNALFRRGYKKDLHKFVWTKNFNFKDFRISRVTDPAEKYTCIRGLWRDRDGKKISSNGLTPGLTNIITDSMIADVVEATLGAAYLSGGMKLALKTAQFMEIPVGDFDSWEEVLPKLEIILEHQMMNGTKLMSHLQEKTRESPVELARVEELLGYHFNEPFYLEQALNHQSSPYQYIPSYERLEFLGDAILDFVVVCRLYNFNVTSHDEFPISIPSVEIARQLQDSFPVDWTALPLDPGRMTDLKAILVSNDTLSFISSASGLCHNILMFSSALGESFVEFSDWVYRMYSDPIVREATFAKFIPWWWFSGQTGKSFDLAIHSKSTVSSLINPDIVTELIGETFPRAPPSTPKVLSDVVEAIIAAVFLDSKLDLDQVSRVIDRIMCFRNNPIPLMKPLSTIMPPLEEQQHASALEKEERTVPHLENWLQMHFKEALFGGANPIKKITEWAENEGVAFEELLFTPAARSASLIKSISAVDDDGEIQRVRPDLQDLFIPKCMFKLDEAKAALENNCLDYEQNVAAYYIDGHLVGIGMGTNGRLAKTMAAQVCLTTIRLLIEQRK